MEAPIGITYYDTEKDLFLRKVSDNCWHAYLPQQHESIPELEALALIRADTLTPMGIAPSADGPLCW